MTTAFRPSRMTMKAVLDHIGIAVQDLAAALAFYRDALGLEIEAPEEVASQRVRAHFVPVGESTLELLEATAPDSPIAKFLEKRGPGLHHITLRVDDIDAALAQLKARGVRLIDEAPRPGAEDALVAFIHPSSAHGVLVELKQARSRSAVSSSAIGSRRARDSPSATSSSISLCDGFFRLDGGAMFGVVPKALWEKQAPADERNRITLAMRPLLVRGARTMLIDAGLGDKDRREVPRRSTASTARGTLDHSLAEAGARAEDIDIVLATPPALRPRRRLHRAATPAAAFGRASRARSTSSAAASGRTRRTRTSGTARAIWRTTSCRSPTPASSSSSTTTQTIMPGVSVRRTGGHTHAPSDRLDRVGRAGRRRSSPT